ncbi:hypothetical protein KUH03_01025 [Sphingobacterium sp. E70]|nr:type VI secretion system tube protein TssD [Sphingobacterium sp. E70]ULT25625.1 hypothetical protein KUH03_01025 [Sphingobacterium sp. E70]
MSFKTRLSLGGKEYDVIQCKFSLHRDVDSKDVLHLQYMVEQSK